MIAATAGAIDCKCFENPTILTIFGCHKTRRVDKEVTLKVNKLSTIFEVRLCHEKVNNESQLIGNFIQQFALSQLFKVTFYVDITKST